MTVKLVHVGADGYIDATALAPDAGSAYRGASWYVADPATDLADAMQRQFNLQTRTIGQKRPVSARVISLRAFLQRCTVQERVAFDALRKLDPVAEVLWSELTSDVFVNLDDTTLITGLAMVKAANAAGGFLIWPDDATADARIAAIRA
jgi:hypothetical protein